MKNDYFKKESALIDKECEFRKEKMLEKEGEELAMQFYFVRHSKTEYNLEGIMQGGSIDSPLLPEGVVAAKRLGEKLSDVEFCAAFASPLGRAQKTAEYILTENKYSEKTPLLLEAKLREMEFGDWDGSAIAAKQQEIQYKNLRNHPEKYNPKEFHGETYEELITRSRKVIDSILEKYEKDAKILLVSHGVTLISLIKNLLGEPISSIRKNGLLDNTSLSIIETRDDGETYSLVEWNLVV